MLDKILQRLYNEFPNHDKYSLCQDLLDAYYNEKDDEERLYELAKRYILAAKHYKFTKDGLIEIK